MNVAYARRDHECHHVMHGERRRMGIAHYRGGTTHIVMSPLEFVHRLAALVPRPRLHLIRFHGVLAPNARLRPDIIPNVPVNALSELC